MRFSALFAAVATFAVRSAVAVECVNGLYILVGRGTLEPTGMGEMGAVANLIVSKIPGSTAVPIDYPASFDEPAYYDESEMQGAQEVYEQVVQYNKDCPGHKMAYLGYSQGAQIASNAFCGGQGSVFGEAGPIPADAVKNVVAIGLFGDPSFTGSAPYNRGTASTSNGFLKRDDIGDCAKFPEKIASYCNKDDRYCDPYGAFIEIVHSQYFSENGEELKDFVVGRYEAAVRGSAKAKRNEVLGARSTTLIAARAASTSTSVSGTATSSSSSSTHRNAAAGVNIKGMLFFVVAAILAAVYVNV